MKNKIRNDIIKKRAIKDKKNFWWKRIGRCTFEKCGGACCRYKVITEPSNKEYHHLIDIENKDIFEIKKVGTRDLIIKNIVCPNMMMNCKCKLHGKKRQPYTCDVFPMHHHDGTYLAVKKYCGYKFIKEKVNDEKRGTKKDCRSQKM